MKLTADAALVIAGREKHDRFEAARLTEPQPTNGTVYPYGHLRQAHTRCFWRRRERQVSSSWRRAPRRPRSTPR